jgi:hypothetical protein
MMSDAEVKTRYTYHPPKPGQPEKYTQLRAKVLELALLIDQLCPESREKAFAFERLDEVTFWANSSIARREP